jgi:hypothetical protein
MECADVSNLLQRARLAGLTVLIDGDELLLTGRKPADGFIAELRDGRDELIRALRDETRRDAVYAAADSDEDRAFLKLDWASADCHAGRATQAEVDAARGTFEKLRQTW